MTNDIKPRSLVITVVLVLIFFVSVISMGEPIDSMSLKTVELQAEVDALKADQARQEAEIRALSRSHEMAIMVNQDLDDRLSKAEGRR